MKFQRKFWRFIGLMAAVILLSGCTPSFNKNDIGLMLKKLLPAAKLIEHGPRNAKRVALTFDACMTQKMSQELKKGEVPGWYDQRIVPLLHKYSAHATFFISGLWAKSYPELVRKFAAEPTFEIGNHTYDHAAFSTPCYGLAQAKNNELELQSTEDILTKLTGKRPRYFRFPGGCYSQNDLQMVSNNVMQAVGWDVVSGDAFLKDEKKIESEVHRQVQNGSIIIMHLDGGRVAPATALALEAVLQDLKKQGYELVTVSELLGE